jgi:hypothetical protein
LRVRVALVAAAFVGGAALLFAVWAFDPATAGFFPPCLFHALTGLQCPGCGLTRGLHALLHGDVVTAWRFNPLLFIVLPPVVALGVWEALRFAGARLSPAPLGNRTVLCVVVVTLGFGVLRNLW